jgi:putative ABC transport system substrate-binding protein
MTKRRTILAAVLALAATGWGLHALGQTPRTAPEPGRTYRIGYSQIVDHPALNDTRRGFLDGLRQAGFIEGQNLVFDYQNAQGDVGNARTIAEKFVADRVDLIAPCTTPNVQAAIRVARGSNIPVVFGCVTNPVDTGILPSVDVPSGANLTGHYGIPPVAQMFDLVLQLQPNARRFGTIFNSAEANSQAVNRRAKAEAERRGLTWVEVQITSSAEVRNAAEALVGRVDVILTPQDNTVASAYDAITRVARDNRIPLFSLDTTTVERGAIASYSNNQYQTGVEWALDLAVPVLLGRDAGTLTPTAYRAFDLYVNTAAAASVGITLPPDMVQRAARRFDR